MSVITPQAADHAKLAPLASRFVKVAALPWEKTRHPGVETKALMADPASGLLTVLTKMAPGARLPDHEHVMVEQTLVLEGALHCGEGVCRTGDFVFIAFAASERFACPVRCGQRRPQRTPGNSSENASLWSLTPV